MHCSLLPVTTFVGEYFILTLLTIRLNQFGQRGREIQNENWTKFRGEMFKKQKNKAKEDVLIVHNKKQENRSSTTSTDSSFADENANGITISKQCDQTDGFDSQGFVDLAPAENQPQLLGPKQRCQVS